VITFQHAQALVTLPFTRQLMTLSLSRGSLVELSMTEQYEEDVKQQSGKIITIRRLAPVSYVVDLNNGIVSKGHLRQAQHIKSPDVLTQLVLRLVDHQVSGDKVMQSLAIHAGKWQVKLRENYLGGWNLYDDRGKLINIGLLLEALYQKVTNKQGPGGAQSS